MTVCPYCHTAVGHVGLHYTEHPQCRSGHDADTQRIRRKLRALMEEMYLSLALTGNYTYDKQDRSSS
jgi:protoporphyrinogen oxidase